MAELKWADIATSVVCALTKEGKVKLRFKLQAQGNGVCMDIKNRFGKSIWVYQSIGIPTTYQSTHTKKKYQFEISLFL